MINSNLSKTKTFQTLWLLKILILFFLTVFFGLGLKTVTFAATVTVYTEPGEGEIETVELKDGDFILNALPKELKNEEYEFLGYRIAVGGYPYKYMKITKDTTFNSTQHQNLIYSIWRYKSWDELPGNTYSYEAGVLKIKSGTLKEYQGKRVRLRNFNSNEWEYHYYYPWRELRPIKVIVESGVTVYTGRDIIPSFTHGFNSIPVVINTSNIIKKEPYDYIIVSDGAIRIKPDLYNFVSTYINGYSGYSEEKYQWNSLYYQWNDSAQSLTISGSGDMPNESYPWQSIMTGKVVHPKKIIIGEGITSIGNNAFNNNNVTVIQIGKDVKSIGANAFNCEKVTHLYNGYTQNQTIGANAFANINGEATVIYVPQNINFANLINGQAGICIPANEKGSIEIRNGDEWYKYIMMSGGVGKFEIVKDFSFSGRVGIKHTFPYFNENTQKFEPGKYIIKYNYYDNYNLRPVIESKRSWLLNSWETETKVEFENVDFYGTLVGNGHTISNVNYGLFNNNYGTISDLVISSVENNQTPIFDASFSSDYNQPTYIANIAAKNYGIIEGVEIEGEFSGSRNRFYSGRYSDNEKYYKVADGEFQSGGIAGENAASGIIRKSHVSAYMRGVEMGAICYKNDGVIYGCASEGIIYSEAYKQDHPDPENEYAVVRQPSKLAGICVENNGLVEQSYGGSEIISYTYGMSDPNNEMSDGGRPSLMALSSSAAGLIVNNNGHVNKCSTGGSINLSPNTIVLGTDSHSDSEGGWKFPSLNCLFSRYINNNNGSVNEAFAGTSYQLDTGLDTDYGPRYTRAKKLVQLTYNLQTSGEGTNLNLYSLQDEKYINSYDAGEEVYNSSKSPRSITHSCPLTADDNITDAAKMYMDYYGYTNNKMKRSYKQSGFCIHNHSMGFSGTKVKSADAKSANPSVTPGLTKTDWTFSLGKYPRPKESLKVTVVDVIGTYTEEVVERTDLDKSKIKFTVYYSDGNVVDITGDSPDVSYPYGVYIANAGKNNVIYFTYTDTRLTGANWPETGYSSFVVSGKERSPVDIVKVEYNGNSVTENMNYNPSNVRVTVLFDNGTQSTYLGSSNTLGITTKRDTLGDVDRNGVINQSDYSMLRKFLTDGNITLTAEQRKEADINNDGKITTADLVTLAEIIDKKVPFNKRVFYVKYAGLEIYKNLTINSVKRKINGLSISAAPEKKRYIEGEDFEAKGMVITVKYDNGEYQSFNFVNGDESFDGLSLGNIDYPIEAMQKGQDRIPITYTENGSSETVWLNISVRQVYLTSIAITQEPNITTYYSGESFDNRGMKITAFYDEGIYSDDRLDNFSKKLEISINNCKITGGSKLNDSTAQILMKADIIDDSNRDMKGYVIVQKNSIQSPSADSLTIGTHAKVSYKQGSTSKIITGTVVGNNYISVSYTENGTTRNAIQPIMIEGKKLTKIEVYQHAHKTTYVEGDLFDASGLIARAYYTDGTTSFIYEKNDTNPNGYEVVNGDQPLPIVTELTIKYTENKTSAITTIPITVTRNDIEYITASYTGPKVNLGEKFELSLVLVNVVYKNGTVDSFYADKLIEGNSVVDIYKKDTRDKDYQLHDSGDNVEMKDSEYINTYTAWYAGLSADFTVTGIKTISQMDFSGSVAQGRRDASEWTETFRGVKVKTVYDYINEYAQDGDSGLANIDGKDGNGIDPATKINPLLWFEREGDWVEPVTNFVMEYKARTNGFLFPETGINEDGTIKYNEKGYLNPEYYELPYLNIFKQNREQLRLPTTDSYKNAGWSDWVSNGDSVGTSNAKRVAYDYTNENPDTKAKTMYIGSAKFRLNELNGYEFKADEDPKILIYINGNESSPYIVTKDNNVEISNIQTIKFKLDGKVRVRDNTGVEQLKNFSDTYRVGYKIGTSNEPYNWKNEWVGTLGIPAECFEAKIQLTTAAIDEFSFASTPFIATEPEDASVILGNKAIFTVKAVGQNLNYQWYKINAADNGNLDKAIKLGGATKYFYETNEVVLGDDRSTYYCIVTNGAGSTTTSQAMLYVVDKLPEITGSLEDIAIENGQSYTFSIAATCQNPSTLKFQWEMTNKNGEWEVVQPASENNHYTLTASKDIQNKYIRCKVINTRGYVYSNPARVSTIVEPSVTITASNTAVNIGTNIIFTSYVTSYAGTPEYSWYVKDMNDKNSVYELQTCSDRTFEFSNRKAGEYKVKCIVKDSNGYSEEPNEINDPEHDKNSVSVKIGNAPNIDSIIYSITKTGTSSEITGTVNKYQATFSANVTSTEYTKDKLSYQWYKNGKTISGATSKNLMLTELSENTQMTILCKVSDIFGNDYLSLELNIEPATNITVK